MKRDFSNSTREQIIGIINDREALYSYDISAIDLFVCKDTDSSDYQVYATDISDNVGAANSSLSGCNSDAETLVLKTNEVFGEAQRIDGQYATIVETDASCTVDGYIGDLKVLINAISVKGLGDSTTDILCNLGKYDSDGVFGDPGEFAADLNNDLYERLYNDLVIDGEMNQALLEKLMQGDSLTDREKMVLAEAVNTVYIDENGNFKYEEFELFLEASYIPVRVALGDDYYLSGAYNDFAEYYQFYVDMIMSGYDGDLRLEQDSEKKAWYNSVAQIRGVVYGVNTYYKEMYVLVDENEETELNIEITLDEENIGWLNVSAEAYELNGYDIKQEISVSCINEVNTLLSQNDINCLESQIVDPNDAYKQALVDGMINYAQSKTKAQVKKWIKDLPHGKKVVFAMDMLEILIKADDAKEQQTAENEKIQQKIDKEKYELFLQNINTDFGSCNASLVSCGGEYTLMNQQYSMEELEKNVEKYNENPTGDPVLLEEVVAAIYYPESADWEHLNGFSTYFGTTLEAD